MDKHKLLFGLMESTIDKTLRNMKENPREAVGDLLKLIQPLLLDPEKKQVASAVVQALEQENSRYYGLMERIAATVEAQVLKSFLYLSYCNVLGTGRDRVKKLERKMGRGYPWAAVLDWRGCGKADFHLLHQCVEQGTAYGIYCYFLFAGDSLPPEALAEALSAHGDCLFVLFCAESSLTPAALERLHTAANTVVALDVAGGSKQQRSLLAGSGLLWGGYVDYAGGNPFQRDTVGNIDWLAGQGGGFLCYVSAAIQPVEEPFVQARMQGRYPLALWDFWGDLAAASGRYSLDPAVLEIRWDGAARNSNGKGVVERDVGRYGLGAILD